MGKKLQCMSCGFKGLTRDENRTESITYDCQSITLSGLTGWFCPECGDGHFDKKSSQRYSVAGDELILLVREQRSKEIRRIRRKLGLTQKEAAAIFGGGVNAFSRYERGEIEPHTSTQRLLQLLDRHPELLEEIRRAA